MKDKDEQTALIGMAIGAAVISLVATQKQINQGSIVDELVRLGRQKGLQRMRSLSGRPAGGSKGTSQLVSLATPFARFYFGFYFPYAASERRLFLS